MWSLVVLITQQMNQHHFLCRSLLPGSTQIYPGNMPLYSLHLLDFEHGIPPVSDGHRSTCRGVRVSPSNVAARRKPRDATRRWMLVVLMLVGGKNRWPKNLADSFGWCWLMFGLHQWWVPRKTRKNHHDGCGMMGRGLGIGSGQLFQTGEL